MKVIQVSYKQYGHSYLADINLFCLGDSKTAFNIGVTAKINSILFERYGYGIDSIEITKWYK